MATTTAKTTRRRRRVEVRRSSTPPATPGEAYTRLRAALDYFDRSRSSWTVEQARAFLEVNTVALRFAEFWHAAAGVAEDLNAHARDVVLPAWEAAEARVQAPARAKAEAHAELLPRVAEAYREVEREALKNKKAIVVKEKLRMSLPTYRKCIREIRERASRDPEMAAALRSNGFPV